MGDITLIEAETFKQELLRFPCSEWLYQGVCHVIDEMPAANEQPEVLYTAVIPLNPRSKKNHQKIIYNRRTNAPMVVQSDIYKQYEKDCGRYLRPPTKPISCPVNVKCIFYRENARLCDLTNLLEAIDL